MYYFWLFIIFIYLRFNHNFCIFFMIYSIIIENMRHVNNNFTFRLLTSFSATKSLKLTILQATDLSQALSTLEKPAAVFPCSYMSIDKDRPTWPRVARHSPKLDESIICWSRSKDFKLCAQNGPNKFRCARAEY